MQKKIVYIKGMHCVSCEKLLDGEFRDLPNVADVKVDRQKNMAEIFYADKEPDFAEIKKIAKKYGYDVFEDQRHLMSSADGGLKTSNVQGKTSDVQSWISSIIIVIVLLFLFRLFQNTGILDRIDLKGSGITFGVAILVGLVASVSSCLAVVGAVIIAFGEKYKSEANNFYDGAVKPNLFFHAGRLGTFFVLGGLLGLIGGEVNISGNFISVFTIIIAVVMAWLGLNILGLLPSISNLGVRMPGGLTKSWNNLKKSEHRLAPFLLGGLSFFLPCGFTQSMQIFALTSGSFWTGGLTLFLFALGTVPALMILGVTASWTSGRKMVVFQKVAGFLVLFFAIYMLQSGLALSGVATNVLSTQSDTQQTVDNVATDQNVQVVTMHITSSGFSPNSFTVQKGVPVKFVIKGDAVTGCTDKLIIPSLNITKNISAGDNVIEFTPTTAGNIPFSCWMGMNRGNFIVQ